MPIIYTRTVPARTALTKPVVRFPLNKQKQIRLLIYYRWGKENEARAIDEWTSLLVTAKLHEDFKTFDAGLRISVEYPFLAASPDKLFTCACHGNAVVEVKCPFKHRMRSVIDAAKEDPDFCLAIDKDGKLFLRKNHAYFYQIQLQMLVTRVKMCYFVVYTTLDLQYFAVHIDEDFSDSLVAKSKLFILNVILPEVLGQYFSKTRYASGPVVPNFDSSSSGLYQPCFCNQWKPDVKTIHCSDVQCRVRIYHEDCLMASGKKRFEKCETKIN